MGRRSSLDPLYLHSLKRKIYSSGSQHQDSSITGFHFLCIPNPFSTQSCLGPEVLPKFKFNLLCSSACSSMDDMPPPPPTSTLTTPPDHSNAIVWCQGISQSTILAQNSSSFGPSHSFQTLFFSAYFSQYFFFGTEVFESCICIILFFAFPAP